jgi:hypothetical protein
LPITETIKAAKVALRYLNDEWLVVIVPRASKKALAQLIGLREQRVAAPQHLQRLDVSFGSPEIAKLRSSFARIIGLHSLSVLEPCQQYFTVFINLHFEASHCVPAQIDVLGHTYLVLRKLCHNHRHKLLVLCGHA